MNPLLQALASHARNTPSAPALATKQEQWCYADLLAEVQRLGEHIDGQVIGLLADNCPAWVLLDLAIMARGVTCVPLPEFFSDAQLKHIIESTGMDRIYTDQPLRLKAILDLERAMAQPIAGTPISQFKRQARTAPMMADKLTFTSGTTAQPKGVCLEMGGILRVAASLSGAIHAGPADRFLSLLPLATLLENISVYAALLAGARVCLPGMQSSGVGVTYLDIGRLCRTITTTRPGMLVMVPQMLKALVGAINTGWTPPDSLRYIAVGGAAVSPALLQQASDLGLPVYEGYGLSEASSVISLNLPAANRPGSVGRPLPHVRLRIAGDGEIQVAGALLRGYHGEMTAAGEFWPTGDLGHLDSEGFLYLDGRKGSRIITAYGRNLSPEWPERELLAQASIAQALVLGDARPFNCALIVPMPGATCSQIGNAVQRVNAQLPDYARIGRWHVCAHPFTTGNDELTANGRPRRTMISTHYQAEIEQLYQEQKNVIL